MSFHKWNHSTYMVINIHRNFYAFFFFFFHFIHVFGLQLACSSAAKTATLFDDKLLYMDWSTNWIFFYFFSTISSHGTAFTYYIYAKTIQPTFNAYRHETITCDQFAYALYLCLLPSPFTTCPLMSEKNVCFDVNEK